MATSCDEILTVTDTTWWLPIPSYLAHELFDLCFNPW